MGGGAHATDRRALCRLTAVIEAVAGAVGGADQFPAAVPPPSRLEHDREVDTGARQALLLIRFFRAAMLVVCLGTAAAAWILGSPTVLGLALVIAAEETWETSVVVSALRHQLRNPPARRCSQRP